MDASRPAITAIIFGVALALALFVPFVAVQYRRHGRLGFRASVVAFAVLVYVLAIVSYTLLPLPPLTRQLCVGGGAGIQLDPLQFVRDIARVNDGGALGLVKNPALWQVLFNIVLFIPLGVFVRALGRRRIVVTTLIGLGVSLLIETTQLTGDWFLFPCAYRLFDVDDLLTNAIGALVGALIAPALRSVLVGAGPDPSAARPVNAMRRLLSGLCDLLFVEFGGGALGTVTVLVAHAVTRRAHPGLPDWLASVLLFAAPGAVELVVILASGRSIGEHIVRLRPAGDVTIGRALVRWLVGIGGFALLSLTAAVPTDGLAGALVVLTIVMVFTTRGHRGLAYVAAGWDVIDERTPRTTPPPVTPATSEEVRE